MLLSTLILQSSEQGYRMKNHFSLAGTVLSCFIFMVLLTSLTYSQPKKGMYGITTAISKGFIQSNNISTNSGSLNIGLAYLPSDRISIRGELGFRSQKDTSEAKTSEFTFTGNVWYYLGTSENVSTFLGGALGFGSATDVTGIGNSLMSLQGFFGADYWLSPRFSWFGHIGIVYASYTIAERPASDIFTSACTGLTWYF
jgi:hypothetical protein